MSSALTMTGSCLCRAIRFSVRPPSLFCAHCHCSICRRFHGAAFGTWFGVPHGQFSLEEGEANLVHFQSSDHGTRSFCGRCGSPLFFESTRHPDRIEIALAAMHDPIDRHPEVHMHFDDRASWVAVNDDLPRFGGASGLDPIDGDGGRRLTPIRPPVVNRRRSSSSVALDPVAATPSRR